MNGLFPTVAPLTAAQIVAKMNTLATIALTAAVTFASTVQLTTASSGLTISKTTGTTLTIASTSAASATTAGGYTSTVATGTAPFTATSTTVCPNLNASLLLGGTWAIPGTIGSTTPNTGAFTTLAASGVTTITDSTAATSISAGGALVLTGAGLRVATGSSFFGGALAIERGAAGNAVFTGKVTGDAQNRVQMVVSGVFSWGDGTSGVDTNLFRDSADSLKTNDSFIVSLGFGLGVTATATAAGTTTLVVGSTAVQTFTGSTTQTIQFPAANARGAGIAILYVINNQSSGTVTPTRAGSDTFQGGGTTDAVLAGATTWYLSDGVSKWLKV